MKFDYQNIETESYQGQRWYQTTSGPYPSITTILGNTVPEEKKKSLQDWRNSLGHKVADEYTKSRADHGTMVHLLAERYLKGEQIDLPVNGKKIPFEDLNAFRGFKLKLDKINEVWGQEVPLFSDFFKVAGRCDLIGKYKDEPAIIDFKTSGRIKTDKEILDYRLQLAFYGAAHNEMFDTNIKTGIILMVVKTGFPMEFKVNLEDFYELLAERCDLFWSNSINSL